MIESFKWYEFSDRLPPENAKEVLVYGNGTNHLWLVDRDAVIPKNWTHWMLVPTPPETSSSPS